MYCLVVQSRFLHIHQFNVSLINLGRRERGGRLEELLAFRQATAIVRERHAHGQSLFLSGGGGDGRPQQPGGALLPSRLRLSSVVGPSGWARGKMRIADPSDCITCVRLSHTLCLHVLPDSPNRLKKTVAIQARPLVNQAKSRRWQHCMGSLYGREHHKIVS